MTHADQDWRPFAERMVEEMFSHKPSQAATISRSESDDRIVTNYFNCDFESRWVLLGHLVTDIVMEIIETNIEEIRDMLEAENE